MRASRGRRLGRALLVASVVALAACPAGRRGARETGARPPRPGPQVVLAFAGLDGDDVTTASYRGRVLVLHFFATWAIAAQMDVPELERARQAGAEVVGVALDPDAALLVPPWRDAVGARHVLALGDAAALAEGAPIGEPVTTVPTTVVLDREGRVAWRRVGGLRTGELERAVRLLEAGGRAP